MSAAVAKSSFSWDLKEIMPGSWEDETKLRLEEITKKVALFILFTAVVAGTMYGVTKLLDLPINFSAQAGGLALGCATAVILVGGAFYIYAQRKYHNLDKFDHGDRINQVIFALTVIATLGVVIAGVSTNTFTNQWQGLAIGFGFTACIIKLVDDHRDRAYRETAFIDKKLQQHWQLNTHNLFEEAKKVALFLCVAALLGVALYGSARLLGANLNVLAPQTTGMILGGTLTLFVVGIIAYIHTLVERDTSQFLKDRIHRLYFGAAVAAIVLITILHFSSVIDVQHAFQHQWRGLLAASLFTAGVCRVVAWNREDVRKARFAPFRVDAPIPPEELTLDQLSPADSEGYGSD